MTGITLVGLDQLVDTVMDTTFLGRAGIIHNLII